MSEATPAPTSTCVWPARSSPARRASTSGPGSIAHWPGGLVAAFPAAHSVDGAIVLAPGDLNLTFKRYVETPVTLVVEDDHVIEVRGDGIDARLFRSYLDAFDDRAARATSHSASA